MSKTAATGISEAALKLMWGRPSVVIILLLGHLAAVSPNVEGGGVFSNLAVWSDLNHTLIKVNEVLRLYTRLGH